MDPITAALVAALSAGMAEVGKEGLLDAYNTLKKLLYHKFGPHSQVFKAVENLEHAPSSPARAAVLQEEVAKAHADQDPDLRQAAYNLSWHVNSLSQNIQGNGNIQVGGNLINGRTGLVVFMAVALVAIFAFLIWQLVPSSRQLVGASPTPTPTPFTATPIGTLTGFCQLVRSSGSDYAYTSLTSDNFKKHVTSQQFNQQWGFINNPIVSCIPSINNSSGTTAAGTIATQTFSGQQQKNQMYAVTLVDQDGKWEIDSLQKQ